MGYILPIQQHEYADYQRRTTTSKRNITSIEKTYRGILKSQYEEVQQETEMRNQRLEEPVRQEALQPVYLDMEELYAELTGLGRFINERI